MYGIKLLDDLGDCFAAPGNWRWYDAIARPKRSNSSTQVENAVQFAFCCDIITDIVKQLSRLASRSAAFNNMQQYYSSWNHLVTRPSPNAGRARAKVGLVVVLIIDNPHRLLPAAAIAESTGARLLVLCSPRANVTHIKKFLATQGYGGAIVLAVGSNTALKGLQLQTDAIGHYEDRREVPIKRNIGIAAGWLMGAEVIWFMDDDISGVGSPEIEMTLAQFNNPACLVAGWSYGSNSPDGRDHSNETHAWNHVQRLQNTGKTWDLFVAGGCMAARVTPDMPLFPQTYNEDWIFVFWALLKNAAAVAHLGTLVQEPRNPFLVHNSAYQFFGNILAPGLFRAVDIGRKNQQDPLWIIRQRAFWQEHVRHRVNFLDDLYTQLERFVNQSESSDPRIIQEISDISGILAAVDAETLPDQLLEYATKLINDMDRWRTWLAGLDCIESGDDFEPALRQLVVN